MGTYLALHTMDPKYFTEESSAATIKAILELSTPGATMMRTLVAGGAGKIACEWEADSQQAVIEAVAKLTGLCTDGIYPAMVIDWPSLRQAQA